MFTQAKISIGLFARQLCTISNRVSTVISKVYLSKWFVGYRDDSFSEINNVSNITDECYISYRRLIRASIKQRFLARSTYTYTSRILCDRILRMIAYVDRFTRSFVCNFDVDKYYNTTRGKKHHRRLVREESFALMTNGCRRDYLIVIGRQVPLIGAFLPTHEISRREIKQMIDNCLGILYGITCPISRV